MKVQRIYIDTSVIGGCFDAEFAPWSNSLVEDFRKGIFKAVLSQVVAAEVADAPPQVQAIYEELFGLGSEIVNYSNEAGELATAYQQRGILTPKYFIDGLHIALATVAEVDLLVSWNFKHIVHFDKIRLFSSVNLSLGYKPLQIFSPREVTSYEQDEH